MMVFPRTSEEVANVLKFAQETGTPWLVIGLGSNILVSDAGFDGIVLRIGKEMSAVKTEADGHDCWTVGAGLPTPILARRSVRAGLAGVHRLIGVPGTVGGGVSLNAGAHGQDFASVVEWIDVVDVEGTPKRLLGRSISWRYRDSGLVDTVVIAVGLSLTPADPSVLQKELRQYLVRRKAGTPFSEPCCGSVFRNPPGTHGGGRPRTAGRLIDAAGLKGFTIGGARVSTMHANYIVNTGTATASDVLAVIDAVRQRVSEEFAIELELEVRVI